jgi:ABC-2 type transport system permease protein
MRYLLAIAFRDYRIRLSNPVLPLWDVLVPVVYLLVFGASLERWLGAGGSGLDYPRFFLGGVLSMVSFGIVFNSSYAFFEDLQGGIFHEMLTYPFARWEMLLGKLLFNGAFAVVGVYVCLAAGWLILKIAVGPSAWLPVAFWSVLGTAGWYFLFTWLALNLRGFNAYHTTTSALYLVLMFISNLFYPTTQLPAAVRWIAWGNPVTWQTDLLRYYTYPTAQLPYLALETVAFIVFVLVTFWLANRKLNGTIE